MSLAFRGALYCIIFERQVLSIVFGHYNVPGNISSSILSLNVCQHLCAQPQLNWIVDSSLLLAQLQARLACLSEKASLSSSTEDRRNQRRIFSGTSFPSLPKAVMLAAVRCSVIDQIRFAQNLRSSLLPLVLCSLDLHFQSESSICYPP